MKLPCDIPLCRGDPIRFFLRNDGYAQAYCRTHSIRTTIEEFNESMEFNHKDFWFEITYDECWIAKIINE
jgi:hypothetical protein